MMNVVALKIPELSGSNEEKALGELIGKLAKKKKIKQTDLAEKSKISRISVNRFFRGKSEVRATDLVNLLDLLGIDVRDQILEKLKE